MRLIDADAAVEKMTESDKIVGSSIWETYEVEEFLDDCPHRGCRRGCPL